MTIFYALIWSKSNANGHSTYKHRNCKKSLPKMWINIALVVTLGERKKKKKAKDYQSAEAQLDRTSSKLEKTIQDITPIIQRSRGTQENFR